MSGRIGCLPLSGLDAPRGVQPYVAAVVVDVGCCLRLLEDWNVVMRGRCCFVVFVVVVVVVVEDID